MVKNYHVEVELLGSICVRIFRSAKKRSEITHKDIKSYFQSLGYENIGVYYKIL